MHFICPWRYGFVPALFPSFSNVETQGGYYFGSVDQERSVFSEYPRTISLTPLIVLRYSIQRFARKISGRVLGEHESISDLNVLIPFI
jgi:hypothetical protein